MAVSVGLVGPAGADHEHLRQALRLMLEDRNTRFIIYLGHDGAASAVVRAWTEDGLTRERFLDQAFELAQAGSAEAIQALLGREAAGHQLDRVRCLPQPPARAVEMLEKWILLAVHDKARLDKDDIANAHVILYGKADGPEFHRFGPRCFFTPGPLSGGRVGRLSLQGNGDLAVQILDLDGTVVAEERCQAGNAKLVVTT